MGQSSWRSSTTRRSLEGDRPRRQSRHRDHHALRRHGCGSQGGRLTRVPRAEREGVANDPMHHAIFRVSDIAATVAAAKAAGAKVDRDVATVSIGGAPIKSRCSSIRKAMRSRSWSCRRRSHTGRIRGCTAKYFAVRAGNLASRAEHRVNRRPVQAENAALTPSAR